MGIKDLSRSLDLDGQAHCVVVAAPAKDKSELLRQWALYNRVSESAFAELLKIISGKIKTVVPAKAVNVDSLGNKTFIERTELGRIKCYNHAFMATSMSSILYYAKRYGGGANSRNHEAEFRDDLLKPKTTAEFVKFLADTTHLKWDLAK